MRKKAAASSFREGYQPEENAFDESRKSSWSAQSGKDGEWLEVDLGKEENVKAVQVNFADVLVKKKHASVKEYGGTISQQRYIEEELVHYQYQAEYSLDGKTWTIYDKAQDTILPHHLLTLSVKARYIRVLFRHAPYDQNFSLSGIRVFGLGDGEKPSIVTDAIGTRLSATKGKISWKKKEDAIGYCIRIGIAKDKLYNSILLYGQNEYKINFLNKETYKYYFAIDSFKENGITKGEVREF